jgi:hypothetical protein
MLQQARKAKHRQPLQGEGQSSESEKSHQHNRLSVEAVNAMQQYP